MESNFSPVEGQEETKEETEKQKQEIDTCGWKTYRSVEYAYQIRYPNDFQIDSSDSENVFIGTDLVHRGPNGVFIRILYKALSKRNN